MKKIFSALLQSRFYGTNWSYFHFVQVGEDLCLFVGPLLLNYLLQVRGSKADKEQSNPKATRKEEHIRTPVNMKPKKWIRSGSNFIVPFTFYPSYCQTLKFLFNCMIHKRVT